MKFVFPIILFVVFKIYITSGGAMGITTGGVGGTNLYKRIQVHSTMTTSTKLREYDC